MTEYEFRYKPGEKPPSPQFAPFVGELNLLLSGTKPVRSEKEYNALLQQIDGLIQKHMGTFVVTMENFDAEMNSITENPKRPYPDPMICPVPAWGGVVHKHFDVDQIPENERVRKLLVVRQRGILGFEYHEKKDERLEVLEGAVLFIGSVRKEKGWKQGQVSMTLAEKGATSHLLPPDEHGIIALTDSIVQERSTNHLSDLFFIYNSIPVIE